MDQIEATEREFCFVFFLRPVREKSNRVIDVDLSLSPLSLALSYAFPWKFRPMPSDSDRIRPIQRRSEVSRIPTNKTVEVSSPPSYQNRSEFSDLRLLLSFTPTYYMHTELSFAMKKRSSYTHTYAKCRQPTTQLSSHQSARSSSLGPK